MLNALTFLNKKEFNVLKFVGAGNFGLVMLGQEKFSKDLRAIKQIYVDNEEDFQTILKEVESL